MIRVLILFTFIFFSLSGSAQILKVNKNNIDSDSSTFTGSVNMDFNLNNRGTTASQQVTYRGLTALVDLLYATPQHAYIMINQLRYFKVTSGPLISTGYSHFRINLKRKQKLSYELFTQLQYDDGRRMPIRYLNGGGVRLSLIDKEQSSLFLGVGVMHENEHWRSLSETESLIRKNIWKTSSYISGHIQFNEHVSLNIISYYQGGYDRDSDLYRNRISGDAEIKVDIIDKLSFTTTFTAQYEDRPIIPINNFIYSLTNGIKWSF